MPSIKGRALYFYGSSNYVDCGNDTSVRIQGPITLMAWIKPYVLDRIEQKIITKESDAVSGYVVSLGNNTLAGRAGYDNTGDGHGRSLASAAIMTLDWQNVAMTYDGSVIRLYRNGVEVASKANTGSTGNPPYHLTLGKRDEYNALFFYGLMDEIRIYNTTLDSATIKNFYDQYKP